jgi:hypothetical protein
VKALVSNKFTSIGNAERERLIYLTNQFTELVKEYKYLIKKFDDLKKQSKEIIVK